MKDVFPEFPGTFPSTTIEKRVMCIAAGVPSVGSQVAVPSPDVDVDRAAPSNKTIGLAGEMAVWLGPATVPSPGARVLPGPDGR